MLSILPAKSSGTTGEVFAMSALGLALAAQGAYCEALTHAENAVTLAQEIDHRWDTVGLNVLGTLYLDLGIATMAHKYFERARVISEEHRILFSLRISLSFLARDLSCPTPSYQGESHARQRRQ